MFDIRALVELQKDVERLKTNEYPGIVYGSFYCDDAAINVTATTVNVNYPVASGMTTGPCKGTTFASSSEIDITFAGVYQVDWSMSMSVDAGSQTIEGVVLGGASGTTAQANTYNANRSSVNPGDVCSVSGHGIITCAAGDKVRLGVQNETASGKVITVNHANFVLCMVG